MNSPRTVIFLTEGNFTMDEVADVTAGHRKGSKLITVSGQNTGRDDHMIMSLLTSYEIVFREKAKAFTYLGTARLERFYCAENGMNLFSFVIDPENVRSVKMKVDRSLGKYHYKMAVMKYLGHDMSYDNTNYWICYAKLNV